MERDNFIAHGARNLLVERYKTVSDEAKVPICDNCGQICIANPNPAYNYYHCSLCPDTKDIHIIKAPTSLRLLYQYNAGMMVKMAMRTAPRK